MKKLAFLLAMIFVLSMTVPAMGQIDSENTDIDTSYKYADWAALLAAKAKAILELELLLKTKRVDIDVQIDLVGTNAAENGVFIKAINDDVYGCEDCTQKDAYLTESIITNSGIVQVNQNVGHINNQGNIVAIAVDVDEDGGTNGTKTSFTESQVVLEQANLDSETLTDDSSINAYISGSINSNTGVVQFNQNSGNVNNQHNIIAMAVGPAAVALNEVALGQVNANLRAEDNNSPRLASIVESINSNTGVVQVNQNVGTLNNQTNIISISGAVK
jgi:hypothetical protein